jgi:transposase-like protein
MKEELFKGLSEEQIARIKECKNQEEVLKLAKEEGVELSEEQLEAVSGGVCSTTPTHCPFCGSNDFAVASANITTTTYCCFHCGRPFTVDDFKK